MVDCSHVFRYEKMTGRVMNSFYALETPKGIRKVIDYNLFEDKPIAVPKGYKKVKSNREHITKYVCGPKQRLEKDNEAYKVITDRLQGSEYYFIHDNGGRPFLVYITDDEHVFIYKQPEDMYIWEADYGDDNQWMYVELVKEYNPTAIWVGKSPKNRATEFSGGAGRQFDGNSILLALGKDKYVFIGQEIYEFSMQPGDVPDKYYSPVGNNDVPYPVLWGKNNIYFMLDRLFTDCAEGYEMKNDRERSDAYLYFYGHLGESALSRKTKKMKGVISVHKRVW